MENIMELPMKEFNKNKKKPLICCVTPGLKYGNIIFAEDDSSDSGGWFNDSERNSNTGWNRSNDNSGCSPCCSPCAPCYPNTNSYQCSPDDDSCYPACNPCNPCYPCNPVEENNRNR